MSDTIASLIQAMEQQVAGVNTTMPGVVVSYDGKGKATIRPSLPKRLANGEELPAPLIYNVPVHWSSSAGGQAMLTLPLMPGDPVMIHFSQRSLEGWLSGKDDAPDDPRMHDISDAIAVPGLGRSEISANPENLELKFGSAHIIIKPDGSITIGNEACSITWTAGGDISVHSPMFASDGEIKAKNNIALTTHKHLGVQPGSGTSGIPTP